MPISSRALPLARHRSLRLRPALIAILSGIHLAASPSSAQAISESAAWQFENPQDLATRVAVLDLIERRRGGVFAAPSYTTNIARQYNCSVAATATGNSGLQSAQANSPSTTGATSSANGNASTATIAGDGAGSGITGSQLNDGQVTSALNGDTTTVVRGTARQGLSSTQTNSGSQSASVTGANACAFGVLN